MRNLVFDILLVGTEEPRYLNFAIVDGQFEPFADQCFDQRHHWALAQIVRPSFETQSEHSYLLPASLEHHFHGACYLTAVADQYRIQ